MICRGIFLGPRLFGVFQKFLNRPLFGQHSMLHHMDRSAEGAECGNIVGDKQDACGFPLLLQQLQQKCPIFRVQRGGGLVGQNISGMQGQQ